MLMILKNNDTLIDVPLYDPKKIIEYPGFNCDMPHKAVDETRHFGVCRIDARHSAKEMRRWMKALQKHHVHRREVLNQEKKDQLKSRKADMSKRYDDESMDLDDSNSGECAIIEVNEKVPVDAVVISDDDSDNDANIEDLEKEREELVKLLQSAASGHTGTSQCDLSQQNDEATKEATGENSDQTNAISFSQSLGVSNGTPLPVHKDIIAPVTVPNREKFSAGIGEHLPFQNLPEAVGTYERLKSVLARKRQLGGSSTSDVPKPSNFGKDKAKESTSRTSNRYAPY